MHELKQILTLKEENGYWLGGKLYVPFKDSGASSMLMSILCNGPALRQSWMATTVVGSVMLEDIHK